MRDVLIASSGRSRCRVFWPDRWPHLTPRRFCADSVDGSEELRWGIAGWCVPETCIFELLLGFTIRPNGQRPTEY
jgi:hypothetical protein